MLLGESSLKPQWNITTLECLLKIIINAGKYVEKLNILYTAGGNVKVTLENSLGGFPFSLK